MDKGSVDNANPRLDSKLSWRKNPVLSPSFLKFGTGNFHFKKVPNALEKIIFLYVEIMRPL